MTSHGTLVLIGNDDQEVVGLSDTSGERSGRSNRNGSLLTDGKADIPTDARGSSNARFTVDDEIRNTRVRGTGDYVVKRPSRIPVPVPNRRDTDTITESSATYCLSGCNYGVTSVDSREFDFDSIPSTVFRKPLKKNKKAVKGTKQYNVDEFLLKTKQRDRLLKRDSKIDDFAYRRKLEETKNRNIRRQNVINTYAVPPKAAPAPVVKNSRKASSYINRMAQEREIARVNDNIKKKILKAKSIIPSWR